jgi:hypothetical protein
MIEKTISMDLDRRTAQVFDFLVDFTNEPAWNPECLEVEQTSAGPIGVGSTYRARMRGVGKVSTELTAYERPVRFATTERSWAATGNFEFRLTPRGEGTRVEIRMGLQPRGPMRLLQPLVRRMADGFLARLPDYVRNGLDTAGLPS